MRAWPLLVCLLAACGGAPARPRPPLGSAETAALVIPPTPSTRPTLARIGERWESLHYLVDLFDHARVARDPAATALLLEQTGVRARDTDAVLDALLIRADRLLAADRLHPGALAVRTLLAGDLEPAATRDELFARVSAWKAIARGAGPLSANAILRLHDLCALALADAATAAPGERSERIATCLYALYDADPARYFVAERAQRPPAPDWRDFAKGTRALAEDLGRQSSRLAPLGAKLVADDDASVARLASFLPPPPDPIALRLPRVTAADPYEHTPLLALGQGGLEPHAKALGEALARDGRGRLAVALSDDARGEVLLDVAQRSQRLGAVVLELAVTRAVRVRPIAGDYWQTRAAADPVVLELAVLPLALADLALRSDQPRGAGWDPARAAMKVRLVIGTGQWQLVADRGVMPPIAVSEDAAAASATLRAQLASLRKAFPDEVGLRVVILPGVSLRAVAQAVSVADEQFTLALSDAGVGAVPKQPLLQSRLD
jgi:hypothetical protein